MAKAGRVYCEWLGQEMGMYKTPYDRFGMLGWQIWRAARLVVDTGIHTQGWTRQQAIDYLLKYTALPEHEIETEVDRYIAWPGQALSYYLGEMAIREGRAKAEKALGPKFNIRAFHDTVLSLGSVPLPVLTAHIDHFIARAAKGPIRTRRIAAGALRGRRSHRRRDAMQSASWGRRDRQPVDAWRWRHRPGMG